LSVVCGHLERPPAGYDDGAHDRGVAIGLRRDLHQLGVDRAQAVLVRTGQESLVPDHLLLADDVAVPISNLDGNDERLLHVDLLGRAQGQSTSLPIGSLRCRDRVHPSVVVASYARRRSR
jgi:hypothetical protein